MALHPNDIVYPKTRSCPRCRRQPRVAVVARDLWAFGNGRPAADCFPYLGSWDLERLETGRCPEHLDAPAPSPPPSNESSMERCARAHRQVQIDLNRVPSRCELTGCPRTASATARVVLGGGLEFLGACDVHKRELERQEVARRLREERASSDQWKFVRTEGDRYVSVPPRSMTFSASEWKVMAHGFVPRVMEDKWFWHSHCFTVHGRRSWTGVEVYRFHVVPTANRFALDRIDILEGADRYPASEALSTEWGRRAEADRALQILRAELLLDAVAPG